MSKRITQRDRAFVQGYVLACSVMIQQHGNTTEVQDCLRELGCVDYNYLHKHRVDEHDIEVLSPVIDEIIRKRNLSINPSSKGDKN